MKEKKNPQIIQMRDGLTIEARFDQYPNTVIHFFLNGKEIGNMTATEIFTKFNHSELNYPELV